jgi:hypothetical protein
LRQEFNDAEKTPVNRAENERQIHHSKAKWLTKAKKQPLTHYG